MPHLLSLIADLSWNGQVAGINQLQAADAAKYGAGSYVAGALADLLDLPGDGRRRGADHPARRLGGVARLAQAPAARAAGSGALRSSAIALPFLANASGWIFTEAGRQPWIVYGLMQTAKGVSTVTRGRRRRRPSPRFAAVYSILGGVDAVLMSARPASRSTSPDEPDAEPTAVPGLRLLRRGSMAPFAELNTLWFALIGLLWAGYLFLEGFDFGVAMVTPAGQPRRAPTAGCA